MDERKALVVDDSAMMRQLVVFALLRIPGMECVEAQDGIDGLRKLKQDQYDLIFLDINMPLMDGLKLLETLRREAAYESVPVVMLTTEGRAEDVERALSLGASDYLLKPVQAQDVLTAARRALAAN